MNAKMVSILKNFKKRNIEGYYAETSEEARTIALSMVEEGSVVSWGGSKTLEETGIQKGLFELEEAGKIIIIDPFRQKDPEANYEARRQGLLADVYFLSANAITTDGELANIDGTGNRVAALTFGPKKVIVVAGINKMTDNLEEAIKRVKEVACPQNAIRLGRKTPCALTGHCCDCLLPKETICSSIVTTRFNLTPGRLNIILINEKLGF
ncbi:MAG: lactate utilization protein [Anaerovoracaceae bacterium]|jgi:hypothetical protein|nr:lactate utilization protein [Anaerovoracaceae bacterium]